MDRVLAFGANIEERCVPISIRDDGIVEQIESFYVTLEKSPDLDSVLLSPTQHMITIINDDGEPKLKSYSV